MEPAKNSSVQDPNVRALIDALRTSLSGSDPVTLSTRKHLKESAERLSLALETPAETVQRVAYYVSSISTSVLPEVIITPNLP